MIRVAVTGAKGRMGSTVVQAVTDAPDMEVVALFDAGDEITPQSVNGAQVAVDFSIPSVTESNVHALLDAGVDVVVGTTGWTEESYARVRGQVRGGVVLGLEDNWSRMMRLGRSEIIGRYRPIDESLAEFDAVEATDVRALAASLITKLDCRALVLPTE